MAEGQSIRTAHIHLVTLYQKEKDICFNVASETVNTLLTILYIYMYVGLSINHTYNRVTLICRESIKL